jgi:hypothetical protein
VTRLSCRMDNRYTKGRGPSAVSKLSQQGLEPGELILGKAAQALLGGQAPEAFFRRQLRQQLQGQKVLR